MKKNIQLLIIISISLSSFSQTLNWEWAKNARGSNSDFGSSIATDALGNIYVTGTFTSPSISFDAITLNSSGGTAMYLAKYNSSGNVLWAKMFDGSEINPWAVTTDASGSIYVTGTFTGTMTVNASSLTSNGGTDIFILKFDNLGNNIWARSAGGNGADNAWSVATDNLGNVFVTGDFHSNNFLFDTVRVNGGKAFGDMYLVKYNSSGRALWAKTSEGSNNAVAFSVATDPNGNVFLTGGFASPAITFGNDVLHNTGDANIFLAKYNNNGNPLWGRSGTGAGFLGSNAVTVDGAGNAYITGYFPATGISFGNTSLNSAGNRDIFLTKYDQNGNLIWARSAGGTRGEISFNVTVDGNGNLFIAGNTKSASITFGSTTISNSTPGIPDIFIAKFDNNGNAISAVSAGGSDDDESYWITHDANGNIYTTGFFFSSEINCGSTTLTNSGSNGSSDMFIAKLDQAIFATKKSNSNEILSDTRSLAIYPNPTTNNFTVNIPWSDATSLEIYNIAGEKIFSSIINGGRSVFDTKRLSKGIYFVRIIHASVFETHKLVVQ